MPVWDSSGESRIKHLTLLVAMLLVSSAAYAQEAVPFLNSPLGSQKGPPSDARVLKPVGPTAEEIARRMRELKKTAESQETSTNEPYEITRDWEGWPATRLALWKCGIIWVQYWHRGSDVRELSFVYGYKPYKGARHPKKLDLDFYWDNDGTSHVTLNGEKCTEEKIND
jgi:hypothetical protein